MITTANLGNTAELFRLYPHYLPAQYRSISKESERTAKKPPGGVPLAFDAERGAVAVDDTDQNTICYGATGSLKTRTIVMPTVKMLAHAGESMIISDPKAEIFTYLAQDLNALGYNIVVINLRDPAVGNSWNPLFIPYKYLIEGNIDKATECINDISSTLCLSERDTNDPYWDYSAADVLFGLIYLLYRYCQDHGIKEEAVNISNLLKLQRKLFDKNTLSKNDPLWHYASEDELISAKLSGTINAASDTMRSTLAVLSQKLSSFTIQPTLLDMLANNDIDIGDIGRKKTAVFLITPDEKTSFHRLVALFIKQSYEHIIYTASQNETNRVERRINYILDEFSSLPAISDFPAMISAARSRDIRFLLVVQSKSQLVKRYREEAETIIANCMNWVFLTSRELQLLREISELCGQQKNGKPNIKSLQIFVKGLQQNNYFLPKKNSKMRQFFERRYDITIGQGFEQARLDRLKDEYMVTFQNYNMESATRKQP